MSLTIPALLRSETVLVAVPELRKAEAVRAALEGPIAPSCPASILQRQANAEVFLDKDSSSLLAAAAQ
jgi:glucosamine-6-phosphate deaminase